MTRPVESQVGPWGYKYYGTLLVSKLLKLALATMHGLNGTACNMYIAIKSIATCACKLPNQEFALSSYTHVAFDVCDNDRAECYHFRTVKLLYEMGLVVEPSGAAAVTAVISKKVPDIAGKRVVAFITGGNVSPHELQEDCDVRI